MVEAVAQLNYDGEIVRYTPPDKLGWEVVVADIAIIAETSYGGPDRGIEPTICFIDEQGRRYLAPMSAPGWDLTHLALRRALKSKLRTTFESVRELNSRIIWPRTLRNLPLFSYTPRPPKGLINRMFGTPDVEQQLTIDAIRWLAQRQRAGKPEQGPARFVNPQPPF